jgi:hypothetical protein
MNAIDLFVEHWNSKSAMTPIDSQHITELELQLNIVLPDSYKYLISTYGLVHTPNVLTKVCDLNSEAFEVQDFLSLEDVYSLSTLYEMSGMPKGHILFASDCKGNMFCFKTAHCSDKQTDTSVWFYHHDLQSITQVSHSFVEWLAGFNKG